MKKFLSYALVLACICSWSPAEAAARIKTNENALALNQAGAWDTVPGAGDTANWTAVETTANTAVLGADTTWQGIVIANPGGLVTISAGNTLTIGAAATDIDMTAATQNLTINAGMILGAANVWDIVVARTLTIGGNVADGGNLLTVQGAGNAIINGILSGSGGLTKGAGAGTLTLGGINTYSGVTTINAGTVAISAASGLGDGSATNTIALAGGTLDSTGGTYSLGTNRTVAMSGSAAIQSDAGTLTVDGTVATGGANTLTLTGAGNTVVSGAISGAGGIVTKAGAGTATLSGTNGYTGNTNLNAGTLNINNASALGTVAGTFVINGGTIDNTSGSAVTLLNKPQSWTASFAYSGTNDLNLGTGAVTLTATPVITTNGTATLTEGGAIGGAFGLTKAGTGTLALTGVNTYSGTTTVNAGTLSTPSNATVAGPVTVGAAGTLSLGASTLTTAGATTTAAGSIINTTVNGTSTSQYGNLVSSAGASAITAATVVNLTVSAFVPNGTQFKIVDGAAAGVVGAPTINVIGAPSVTFTNSSTTSDLILTANRSTTTATTANNSSVASVVNGISNPTGDLATALAAIDSLPTASAQNDAYASLEPSVDAGLTTASLSASDQSVGALTSHLGDARGASTGETGIATGDQWKNSAVWAKGFGDYGNQDRRNGIDGFKTYTFGTAIGIDAMSDDNLRLGVDGGYAFSNVDSKGLDNANTDIDSYQGTLYGSWTESPWYLDGAFSFAWNSYDGRRDIPFLGRRADSSFDGQEYIGYIGTGYVIQHDKWEITPIASLQYTHLAIDSYTETGAGDVNLHVGSQSYDVLQSGVGGKIAYPMVQKNGTWIPEVHAQWLYDFIGDRVQTTSNFTGGGASFATNGFSPAQSSFNVGAELKFITKGNWTLIGNYDFQAKADYYEHSGVVTARYAY